MPYNTKLCVILLLISMKQMIADSKTEIKNPALCPRPEVGTCSCEWIGPFAKVTCRGLDALPEKLPVNTTNIIITHGTIKEIQENYFLPLKYLQSLELQNNKISNRFHLPKSLWSLNLENNMLNSTSLYGMFDGITKLRYLEVSSNPMNGNLIPGTFSSLRNLEHLMMRDCDLNDIKEGTFSGLFRLQKLYLRENRLQTLKKGAFKGIRIGKEPQLILHIDSNNITHIDEGTFEDAKPIGGLTLNRNRLTVLPDLRGITETNSILYFDDNNITDISSVTKYGLKSITELSLIHNKVSTMPVFNNLRILQKLNLADNSIKELPARFLEKSSIMNTLMLNDNQIEKIHKDSFKGLHDLQYLYLFNNHLKQLPDGVFANLTLENLFLNGNKMTKLTGRPFKGMKKTKTAIYIFGNDIQHIGDDFFNDLGNETMLDIRCKNLKNLPHIQRTSLSRITCAPNQLGWIRKLNSEVASSLSSSGFYCNKTSTYNYNCIPCNVGSFQAKGRENRPCIDCSAGKTYNMFEGCTDVVL